MGCHDIYLVESETEHQVKEGIECRTAQAHPHQTGVSAVENTGCKEQENECFEEVADGPIVSDKGWARYAQVFEQFLLMQLDAFSKEVSTMDSIRGVETSVHFRNGISDTDLPR